ncbi:AMP-binding protein [Nocardiaceae bacterium YC2-7]|uniref:AMP-binding protein n=1 Tax=Antrihabitans stalactiti TaxID=2584121 RepID=A0A848K9Z8_9NOCA|nr:AMP-binding protein [Antrihabitans stalactiti]
MVSLDPDKVMGPLQRLIATAQNGLEVMRLGGLDTGEVASPFDVVERKRMYKLRHYHPETEVGTLPPVLLVPPLMVSADVYDVTSDGAVGILHRAGLDPWVVDFGSPATEEGGWERDLADHIVAVSDAIDDIHRRTKRDVHIAGYSQGGMFTYQAAAFRKCENIASIMTFGSPVDAAANMPLGVPVEFATKGAEFLADHVFNRLSISDTMVKTGFQLLDPIKTVKSRIDFVRQLHDREALLPREQQRRFLSNEGWVPYSGPAIADLLKQFVVGNRMMSGGFVVRDQVISLADLTIPILSFVGEVDDIGQPAAVRGIRRAAPNAEVFEADIRAGHFGLVVGTKAATITWPAVADWVQWREDLGPRPELIYEMSYDEGASSPGSAGSKFAATATSVVEVTAGIGREIANIAQGAFRGTIGMSSEAARALPRLARLGQIQPHTQISFGSLLAEQGRRAPLGECFLFDDRVHTNAAVNTRIDNVVRGLISVGVRPSAQIGVLMETRPSALVTIAALSRLGAVAVLLPPGTDLPTAIELSGIDTLVTDPNNLKSAAATGIKVLVLGGGEHRGLDVEVETVIDLEQIDPGAVRIPAWYKPNPGLARELAFILVAGVGDRMELKPVTNHRWALSAFGTATSANLGRQDTVYCLAPLHHSSGLLVSVGGAVAGGSRIALGRGLDPDKFVEEIHRYGVTVVTYTWTMMREILAAESLAIGRDHPIRLFIGSGMPVGLWYETTERFKPARVLEFYASIEGDVVLANVSGIKAGCKGRPVPGTAHVELAAYDAVAGKFIEQDDGFVRRCETDEVGLLMSKAATDGAFAGGAAMRGVFDRGDAWIPTENLFRRDADGDYWLVDNKKTVVKTARGPVFTQPIIDLLDSIPEVDLAVAYGVEVGGRTLAVAAVTLHKGAELEADTVTSAIRELAPADRPDLVHVVDEIALSSTYRPSNRALAARGMPAPGPTTWAYEPHDGAYKELTAEVAAMLFPTESTG